jgi:splicing factor U2AF subunit
MVTPEDLASDEDYNDIIEDTREECGRFGAVLNVAIPRGQPGAVPGVGFVFVEFQDPHAAQQSAMALGARTFDGKRVEATFYDEQRFQAGDFSA